MEWKAIVIFLSFFAVAMMIEVYWLVHQGWSSVGRSVAYVFTTNLVSLGFCAVILYALTILMMVLVGPLGGGPALGNEPLMWTIVALVIFVLMTGIFLVRRLFLSIFKIKDGRSAWVYSIVSAIVIPVVVFVPPVLFSLLT